MTMETQEQIVDIAGYEGLYAVTTTGEVYSYRAGKVLKPREVHHGYKRVNLARNKQRREMYIHRLVAAAFLGLDIENEDMKVDHIDHDPTNNHVSNLRVVSHGQNCRHRRVQAKGYSFIGSGNLRRPWEVVMRHPVDNKMKHIAVFEHEEDAADCAKIIMSAWRAKFPECYPPSC